MKLNKKITLKPVLGAKAEAVAATAAARTKALEDIAVIGMKLKFEVNNITRHFSDHVSTVPSLKFSPATISENEG